MGFNKKLSLYGLFLIINIVFSILIACRYFVYLPNFPQGILAPLFLVSSLIGQMALLGGVVGLLGLIFVIFPKPIFLIFISLLSSLVLSVLVIDTFVFAQYRFHINEVVLKLVMSGDVVDFSILTWTITIISFIFVFIVEYLIASFLWQQSITARGKKKFYVYGFIIFFFLSNFIHIWAAANAYQPVLIVKNYLPLFQPATANRLMQKYGWIDEEALAEQRALSIKTGSDVHYPLSTISYNEIKDPINVVFLVIDSWRFDTFNEEITPNLWSYAQSGRIYPKHYATGNATRTGIFGLFYGIPGTYWHSMLANQRSPIMMDRFQQLGYQIGAFASASLLDPEFNRTVFSKIPNLRVRSDGDTPSARDIDLTQDWLDWYSHIDKSKPQFSFLFYDAPHGYDFPKNYKTRFEPMLNSVNYLSLNNEMDPEPFKNRYKTSVHFVDSLAKKVLQAIEDAGQRDNTIVIMTGDHGQEFNDNKLNFWGHNGNFTPAQTHVPFAIVGPMIDSGRPFKQGMTSHEDVVPTLMQHFLGAAGDSSKYSTGLDLLSDNLVRDWVMSSSYSAYAMINEDSILEVGRSGQYQLLDLSNRAKESGGPGVQYMKEMLEHLSRFKK
ncbi:DUF3413 domain-containing protein [Marinomonas sp. THO17]|uniref:DUF3413 domain-containing protein n=1 Tax=Marinomonas sp. THO17 TaxID=3149048 RepID=UPI00336BE045